MNWAKQVDAHRISPVAITTNTTALDRLKLDSYMDQLGNQVIYYDNNSAFFVTNSEDDNPLTSAMMGDITDEFASEGVSLCKTSIVSGRPKFYACKFIRPDGS